MCLINYNDFSACVCARVRLFVYVRAPLVLVSHNQETQLSGFGRLGGGCVLC